MKKQLLSALVLGLASTSVFAMHQAGDFFVRAGAVGVLPNTSTNNAPTNAMPFQLDTSANVQLGLTGTYMVTDNIGVELLAATPFSHEIKLDQLGGETIAKTKHLPPSLYVQYYFGDKESKARPYLGLGVNYTNFFHEKEKLAGLTDLKLKDSWGLAANAGVDIAVTDNFFVNGSMWFAKIKSEASFNFAGAAQKADVTLDPMVFFLGVGYRF